MNKLINLTLSGVCMLGAGIVLIASESIGINISKILVPLLFVAGGVSAYVFALANKQHKIARQYHLLQSLGMVVFGIMVALIPENLGEFLRYVSSFLIFFGFIEIIFGFMALNTGEKLNMRILISRFVAGFVNLIGGVLILTTSVTNEMSGLLIAGILIIIGGLAFIVFSNRIGKMQMSG